LLLFLLISPSIRAKLTEPNRCEIRTETIANNIRNNDKAFATFIVRKAEIDSMLARLQALSDEHFHAHPENIHWGQVGDLADMATKLREITDSAFSEGEYAE
jgi:hypothetical protein